MENLAPIALRALGEHDELLRGARGAIRDYLLLRVHPHAQYPYVQTLASWMNGLDPTVWKLPDGSQLPPAERTGMLAVALNELAASDESRMSRPIGDTGNLRTKLGILLRKRGRQSWDGSGMTAKEEEDREIHRRREAARKAQQEQEEKAERELDERIHEAEEAQAWFEGQEKGLQEELLQEADERAKTMAAGGVPRSKVMDEMCLLQAIKARRAKRPQLQLVGQ